MPQFISVSPIPPIRGQMMTITYDFDAAGVEDTQLGLEFVENANGSCGVELSAENPSAQIEVPHTANGFTITDEVGGSDERIGVVGG